MAVRLDIRPRLTLPAEPRAAVRRRVRLPPLAIPAAGYWLAMGALTYVFAHLGPHPLEQALAATEAPALRTKPRELAPRFEPSAPAPATEPVATPEPTPQPAAEPAAEPTSSDEQAASALTSAATHTEPVALPPPASDQREARPPEQAPTPPLDFPSFTDSSRPTRREHAADGPRIDSLFEKSAERPEAGPAVVSPPVTDRDAPVVASSCEAAIAHHSEQIEIGGPRGPADISREAYAHILQDGHYLSGCQVPERTVFEICAAVKDGHAVGITVVSNPASTSLNTCVRRAVSRLSFPQSPRLDVTHTRFDAQSH